MSSEKLIKEEDESDNIIEGFNVLEEKEELSTLKKNKCPIQLGQDYFGFDKSFKPAKRCRTKNNHLLLNIFIPIFLCIIFYLLITLVILTRDLPTIIYACIMYVLASLVQLFTFPDVVIYDSKEEFGDYLKKVLNCQVRIGIKFQKKTIEIPVEYTTDITEKIEIPKSINIVKIEKEFQYFYDSGIKELLLKCKTTYGDIYTDMLIFSHSYENEKIIRKEMSIWVNSNGKTNNMNFMSRILSLLLLHWIKTIYIMCSSKFNYVSIIPAKLLTTRFAIPSPTKLNIYGTIYKPDKDCVEGQISEKAQNSMNTLENDYDSQMRNIQYEKERKERKRKREEDRENNTEILSDFSTNNYTFEILKIYDEVYARIKFPRYKEMKHYIGKYNPEIKQEYLDYGKETVVIPNGFDVKICIMTHNYDIDIKFEGFHQKFERRGF
jgi:hypothetical protein